MRFRELLDTVAPDVLFATEAEWEILGGAYSTAPTCVLKRGARGCTVLTAETRLDFASVESEVVDTTGAGDALAAGFLLGGSLEEAARRGLAGGRQMHRHSRVDAVIRITDEVREAPAVVALETTLVAHGFPPGEGVEVGLESERQVRAAGAVPATVGVLDGEIVVGLTADELGRFGADARKVGPRDLAAAAAQRAVGATTVGGTLAVMQAVGIRWLATGGLGGVHRGFPHPPDVSADLAQLARTQALVVSAGVKSLLDVPATAEVLETLGVPVLGFRTDTLPLFYAAAGGPPVSARVESAAEAAELARLHWQLDGQGTPARARA